jgi:hypothetical protein
MKSADEPKIEASGNDVLAHFFRFMNRRYSFFTVHETEKTEMQNYLSRFVKNKYITVTIRIFRLK